PVVEHDDRRADPRIEEREAIHQTRVEMAERRAPAHQLERTVAITEHAAVLLQREHPDRAIDRGVHDHGVGIATRDKRIRRSGDGPCRLHRPDTTSSMAAADTLWLSWPVRTRTC